MSSSWLGRPKAQYSTLRSTTPIDAIVASGKGLLTGIYAQISNGIRTNTIVIDEIEIDGDTRGTGFKAVARRVTQRAYHTNLIAVPLAFQFDKACKIRAHVDGEEGEITATFNMYSSHISTKRELLRLDNLHDVEVESWYDEKGEQVHQFRSVRVARPPRLYSYEVSRLVAPQIAPDLEAIFEIITVLTYPRELQVKETNTLRDFYSKRLNLPTQEIRILPLREV